MKLTYVSVVLCLVATITSTWIIPIAGTNQPGLAAPAVPVAATLSQDIKEISRLVPMKQIRQMTLRYLLNDAEFQTFVRIINSHDAFMVAMRFRTQPEVMAFQAWTAMNLRKSLEIGKSMEIKLFDAPMYTFGTTNGWQGFWNELSFYYPIDYIRMHIEAKVAQNGIFAQFWQRLGALKVVYERILITPEAQRVIAQLQANGFDFNQLDDVIRKQFNWMNVTAQPTANVPVSQQNFIL